MHFVQTRLKRSRLIALCMAAVLCVSVLIPASSAFAAVESVKSPDGLITYLNGGATYVTSDTTVLVTYAPGDVFYAFTPDEWVDVYYSGVAGQPNGSYFAGNQDPAVNGGFVTNIGAPSSSNGAAALGPDSLITVAFPGSEERSTLIISTYSNGVLEGVYTHTFISLYSLSLVSDQNDVKVTFHNNSSGAVAATAILAAYNAENRLLSVTASSTSGSVAADGYVNVSINKLADAAYYKAYAWHSSTFVPLLPAVTVNAADLD